MAILKADVFKHTNIVYNVHANHPEISSPQVTPTPPGDQSEYPDNVNVLAVTPNETWQFLCGTINVSIINNTYCDVL